MANIFPSDPAVDAAVITPSDTASVGDARSLYIGGAGNVQVETALGSTVLFTGLQAGSILPVRCVKVFSTNTTATTIAALY